MGRQTQLHMLEADCRQLLEFICQRDPVFAFQRCSLSPRPEPISEPWKTGDTYVLWNQSVSLAPVPIECGESTTKQYCFDFDIPLIELSFRSPEPESWNARPALRQGRVWCSTSTGNLKFDRWYAAVVRWIRKNFIRNPVPLDGFVGPAAYEWYKQGGTLLPWFFPPPTQTWMSWIAAQDQNRSVFK